MLNHSKGDHQAARLIHATLILTCQYIALKLLPDHPLLFQSPHPLGNFRFAAPVDAIESLPIIICGILRAVLLFIDSGVYYSSFIILRWP